MSNKKTFIVAVSGWSGCGNTTVSRMLANRIGLRFINYTFRNIAKEDGISFDEVRRRAESNEDYDRRTDETQVRLARETSSVVGSRLAIWLIKDADIRIFLSASPEVRSQRVQTREGGTLEEQLSITNERDAKDHSRYKKLYGIDNKRYEDVDIIVNTERLSAAQVVDILESAVRSVMNKLEFNTHFLSSS